ncbi:hypothetical protein RFI_08233 [Reticulomyxa filosa]|uniref:Uncharacterized protein n=1 Tax=Reticulomyxa filosa TaxID=46433 RepID=X6NRJ6_RETFI|nr:hypothetical protein RFI_08233 [Reticulomyxa filosa]|eukprot:ETO28895.1 hypothetical protein RFI_08233 [Reticulomyxa filosa]
MDKIEHSNNNLDQIERTTGSDVTFNIFFNNSVSFSELIQLPSKEELQKQNGQMSFLENSCHYKNNIDFSLLTQFLLPTEVVTSEKDDEWTFKDIMFELQASAP